MVKFYSIKRLLFFVIFSIKHFFVFINWPITSDYDRILTVTRQQQYR